MYMSMYTHNKIYNIHIYMNIYDISTPMHCNANITGKCLMRKYYINNLKIDKVIFYNCEKLISE